jgi:hypothetical protein
VLTVENVEVDVVIGYQIDGGTLARSFEVVAKTRRADFAWVNSMIRKHLTLPTNQLILVSWSGFTKGAQKQAATEPRITLCTPTMVAGPQGPQFETIDLGHVRMIPQPVQLVCRNLDDAFAFTGHDADREFSRSCCQDHGKSSGRGRFRGKDVDVKLTNIAFAGLVAVGLAACASTPVTPPTASPTLAPTVDPSVAPTPTATPIPPTPTPMPGVYVTVTCSNVPVMWAQKPFPKGAILGIATWHNLTSGDYLGIGLDITNLVTSPTMSIGVEGLGIANNAFQQGTWSWTEASSTAVEAAVAHGNLTIPACPGKSI